MVARGPVRPGERAFAPDLARGCMLLLIVLSNTGFHLWAAPHGASGWHPVGGSALDRAVQLLMITVLDLRIYPLFAFLFGHGMMQLFLRQTAAGTSGRAAVALLRRRSLWLIAFGLVHAALLMAGDILGSYGLASLWLGWLFLRRAESMLLVWSAIAHIGVLEVPPAAVSEQGALRLIADGTGLAGGLGYVALFGLIAHRMPEWGRRHPTVVAVGKRSLSSYLAHPLVFAPLLAAWGLGLGALLGSATMAAFAVGVWLVTVVGAYAMDRAGWRGPAEVLLRRLTSGPAGRAAPVEPTTSR
jgi:uncharacterized membrane protein YeiB